MGQTFKGGGMSSAALYKDQHLDRLVVIKTLKPTTDHRRIIDELSALLAIRSKHVVQIYDVIRDSAGNVTAIVEEYLPGADLVSVPVPASSAEFLTLLYQVAEGIADVHQHARIHRDIKPQNMKFDSEGCLKIFDFGLARDSKLAASTVGAVGTRGYMAPELFQSGRVSFTKAVDTYAFGVTALALATRFLPSDLKAVPPKLPCSGADFRALSLGLPDDLALTLNNCLHSDPNRRPEMADIAGLVGLHLLRDRHRALLVSGKNTYFLDKDNRTVSIAVASQGSLKIRYDGLRFVVSDVLGEVAINNMAVSNGDTLPASCVIVLGAVDLGPRRTMITVDVSHPEVGR